MLTPALTEIERPTFEVGRLATEMLIEGLAHADAPRPVPATPARER